MVAQSTQSRRRSAVQAGPRKDADRVFVRPPAFMQSEAGEHHGSAPISPARGLLLGMALGAALWVAMGVFAWLFFR